MKNPVNIIAVMTAAALLPNAAGAQGKKQTAVKPTAKPTQAAPRGPIVLGTNQMPGDFGQLGQTYTIGQRDPINFTLRSAEYAVTPYSVKNNTWGPKADEKVLVLHYTVHNPLPKEQNYDWSAIRFTAVDAKDTNHDYIQAVTRDGTSEPLSILLKPAQKVEACAVIIVPAEGVVPKLIVEREKGAPVIRYDLRGKVKGLPSVFADPSDPTGATALKVVAAQPGQYQPMGAFDVRLDETAYTSETLIRREPGKGKRWMTVTFTIRNRTARQQGYSWSDFFPVLRDADGEKVAYTQALLKASRDEVTSGTLEPGEEARVRFFFPLPENVAGKSLTMTEGKVVDYRVARAFTFDVSGAK